MQRSRFVIIWGNLGVRVSSVCQRGDVVEGEQEVCSPLHWFGRKLPDFPQRNGVSCSFPVAWALPGPGSGPSPSSKAEPRGAVVRQGSFRTPLTGRANCVRFICNWKHNSCRSLFFTRSVCPQYCRVHRQIFDFFFPSLYSSRVILGQSCRICETFQSTWNDRGASKDADASDFSQRIAFYSLL